jgi:two-component system response regulator FlrC
MLRILTADDDPVQLDLRKALLEGAGYAVATALSVRETTRALERGGIDLVMMDLRFPGRDGKGDCREGIRLIRLIRELDSRVPIIVLSGWPEDLENTPEERMVSRVMLKPVKPAHLLAATAELLPRTPLLTPDS